MGSGPFSYNNQEENMSKLLLLALIVLLVSCDNATSNEVTKSDLPDSAKAFLAKEGFDVSDYIETTDEAIVDDQVFDLAEIHEMIEKDKNKTSLNKQYRTRYLASQSRVRDIKVKFASNMNRLLKTRTLIAMSQINAIRGSKVRLRMVTRGAYDIYIRHGNVPSARGTFPSRGKVGKYITYSNRWKNWTRIPAYNMNTPLHELGHNIGLRHDHAVREGVQPWQHISGTPMRDYRSVMSYNRTRYFTYNDKKAISKLYPR